ASELDTAAAGAIAISHKMLRDRGVVCDTCAADGEHSPGVGGNGKGAGVPSKHDAINFDGPCNSYGSSLGDTESRDIVRTIRHCWRSPIGGGVPIIAGRVEIPSCAVGECGLKNEE